MRPLPFSGQTTFTILFWLAILAWILPELLSSKRRQSGDKSRTRDRGSMMVVAVLSLFGPLLAVWLSLHVLAAAMPSHRIAIFFTGVGLILAGLALRWYAILTLGKCFTFDVAVREGQRVIEAGPYRMIRHPSYAAALITTVGFGLTLGNWGSLAAAPLCLLAGYFYRMHVEEAALLETIGEPYRQYMSRTQRLVPFLY